MVRSTMDHSVRPQRGIAHVMHPQVLGGLIGASGATAFVHANRGALADPWPMIALIAWSVLLLIFIWKALLQPRQLPALAPPSPWAGLVYGGCVLGMLAVMAGGMAILTAIGRPELQPGVVVAAVGLHFVPFATTFRAPVFGFLGWSLTAIGLLGLGLGLASGAAAVAGAAVLTGLVMLALMTVDVIRVPQDQR
jgi:hypothetical protein